MPNRLSRESSLYLRQHADNPVDWWPYCDEAFELARTRDVPVFISIGYSACHWCHVMERECFEDHTVAAVLNREFVPIKVDREERPDIDAVYMEALQASTGGGGWPMSVFTTPDGRPFYTGTYFPKLPGRGMPGFLQVLDAITNAWRDSRVELVTTADQLIDAMRARTTIPNGHHKLNELDTSALMDHVALDLAKKADRDWGGFGATPKFPQPHLISFLLRHYYLTGDRTSLEIACSTLDQLASGGIFDHLGGGFSRYSVDRFWTVPHFEKMLYDQAGLIKAYSEAYLLTGSSEYAYVVEKVIDYVREVLTLPSGGIATAQDADSDGEEGAYYIFRLEEINEILGNASEPFVSYYGATRSGNFEGRNILRRPSGSSVVPSPEVKHLAGKIHDYRWKRNPPAIDDKVVCEWNAKYASSLLFAASSLGRPDWAEEAISLIALLNTRLWDPSTGELRRILFGSEATVQAMAIDYVELASANFAAFCHTGSISFLEESREILDTAVQLFWDSSTAGFFTSAPTPGQTLPPTKDIYDTATLSTNSAAAELMVRVGVVTSDNRLLSLAQDLIDLLINAVAASPPSFSWIAWSAVQLNGGLRELVMPGEPGPMWETATKTFLPDTVTLIGSGTGIELFSGRSEGSAYLCVGSTCDLPAQDQTQLLNQLRNRRWTSADWNQR